MSWLFKWLATGALALLVVLGALLWWAASSPTALQWLVAEAVKQSHGALTLEGISGSLLGRIQVRKLVYATPDLRVTVEDAAFEISSTALRAGKFELTQFDAALLDVYTAPSDKAPELPKAIALPINLTVNHAALAKLRFKDQSFERVEFGYAGGKDGHALRDLSADTAYGHLAGELQISGARPYALSARATLDAPSEWNAQLSLGGDLVLTKVNASGAMRGSTMQLDAEIAAFEKIWLRHARARGEHIDIAAFKEGLPSTLLAVDVRGEGKAGGLTAGTVALSNSKPGPISANRVPVAQLSADFALDESSAMRLSNIAANVNNKGGTLRGDARIGGGETQLDLLIRGLDLRALHAPLYATRLDGKLRGRFTGDMQSVQADIAQRGIRLEFDGIRRGDAITIKQFRAQAGGGAMQGSGEANLAGPRRFHAAATLDRVNPAAFGEYPPASINGLINVDGTLVPAWRANLALTLNDSIFRGVRFAGAAAGEITADTAHSIKVDLTAGANSVRARGGYGAPGEALTFALDAQRLSQLDARLGGALTARGTIGGEAKRPLVDVDITGSNLAWDKSVRISSLSAHAKGTQARHTATVDVRGQDFDVNARAEGGWEAGRGWSGLLNSFENAGAYAVHLMAPMHVEYGNRRVITGPAQLTIAGGRANLEALAWRDGRLDTRGDITGVPASLLLAMAGAPSPRTTLLIGGSWSIAANPALNGTVTLARETGDVVTPGDTALTLGLERLRADVRLTNDAVNATFEVNAKTLSGRAQLTLNSLARDAVLRADGRFDVASLDALNPLIGTHALLRGKARADLKAAGTLAVPQLNGTLAASELGITAPQYGVRLHDGALRAELNDKALTVSEFAIRGDEGTLAATGSMDRSGGEARVAWRADHLSVLNRPDMRLKVDGSGTAALANKKLVLRGTLAVDEGRLALDTPRVSKLDNDIVIVGRPRPASQADTRSPLQSDLLDVDVALDAGSKLYISGAGLNTYLGGKLNLKTNSRGILEAHGVLSSVRGVFTAFGQRLEIERGRLLFNGAMDNPGLDIVATRKNLAVEAGVEVTGTVRVPNVQLRSNPPVSDGEKLAWITLGHGLDDVSGADLSLLQAAASALVLKNDSVSMTQRIAKQLGLDELSLKGGGEVGSQVAAVGKRLSDKIYLEYQQGMAATSAAVRLSYTLTQSLSLRLNAGVTSGIGLSFSRSYK